MLAFERWGWYGLELNPVGIVIERILVAECWKVEWRVEWIWPFLANHLRNTPSKILRISIIELVSVVVLAHMLLLIVAWSYPSAIIWGSWVLWHSLPLTILSVLHCYVWSILPWIASSIWPILYVWLIEPWLVSILCLNSKVLIPIQSLYMLRWWCEVLVGI